MKSYTDLKQSRKLAEILPLESADMYWVCENNAESRAYYGERPVGANLFTTHCWSLAALLDVLPEGIIENYYAPNLQKENGKYSIAYGNDELLCIASNPVDACYEMILKLHELNLL